MEIRNRIRAENNRRKKNQISKRKKNKGVVLKGDKSIDRYVLDSLKKEKKYKNVKNTNTCENMNIVYAGFL